MASRMQQFFIHLRAIGASKTKRDLDKVAESVEELDDKTEKLAESVEKSTDATEDNSKALKGKTKATKETTKATKDNTKETDKSVKTLQEQSKATEDVNKKNKEYVARIRKTLVANRTINNNIMASNKKYYASIDATYKKIDKLVDEANKKQVTKSKMIERAYKEHKAFLAKERREQEKWAAGWSKMYEDAYKEHKRFLDREKRVETARARQRQAAVDLAYRINERSQREIAKSTLAIERKYNRLRLIEQAKHDRNIAKQTTKRNRIISRMRRKVLPVERVKAPEARHPLRVVYWATILYGIMDLIPLIGTALNAAAAGVIALGNALVPVVGLMGTLPGIMLSMAQAGGIIYAINKSMPSNFKNIKKIYIEMAKATGRDNFWRGTANDVRDLAEQYLPILNKALAEGLQGVRLYTREFIGFLRSTEGVRVMTSVLDQNNGIIALSTKALFNFTRMFLYLADAAGPVLTQISGDLANLFRGWGDKAANNKNGIAAFFDKGYSSLKRMMSVGGRFLKGFYNIMKLSAPLGRHLADNFDQMSKNFLKWTKSKDGVYAISQYFKDMERPLDALGALAWDFAKAIFEVSNSQNFIEIVDSIRKELLPSLVKIIKSIDGRFIGLVVDFIENLAKLAEAGAFAAILDIGERMVKVIGWLVEKYNSLGDSSKNIVVWAVVLSALFGGFITAIVRGLAFLSGGLFKLWRQQKALNALAAKPAVAGGATSGKGKKGGSASAAGRSGATVVGGAGGGKKKPKRGATARRDKGGGYVPMSRTAPRRAAAEKPKMSKPAKTAATAGGGLMGGLIGVGIAGSILQGGRNNAYDAAANNTANTLSAVANNAAGAQAQLDSLFAGGSKHLGGLGDALRILGAPTAWDKTANGMNVVAAALGGVDSTVDTARGRLKLLDSQLVNMPAGQAANAFYTIRNAAAKQGVPVDKLIEMFPQYRDQVKSTINPMDKAGNSAQGLADKMSGIGKAISGFELKKLRAITAELNKSLGNGSGGSGGLRIVPDIPGFFAGGSLGAGQLALTGELGPELTVDRSGNFGLVGLKGPELFSPKSTTAIVPSSATFNPLSGNYGNAPDWARMALQSTVNNNSGSTPTEIPANRRSQSTAPQNHYHFGDITVGSSQDINAIKGIIMDAIKEADRDRRERSSRR